MAVRRHGVTTAFFDGTTTFNQTTNPRGGVLVSNGATSQPVYLGRGGDNFSFYISVATAVNTQWLLQCAPTGSEQASGIDPDHAAAPTVWYDAWYLGTSATGTRLEISITGASAVMTFVPDFAAGWARLKRLDATGNITVTAGFEIQGD